MFKKTPSTRGIQKRESQESFIPIIGTLEPNLSAVGVRAVATKVTGIETNSQPSSLIYLQPLQLSYQPRNIPISSLSKYSAYGLNYFDSKALYPIYDATNGERNAGGGIRTHEPIRDRILSPAPLTTSATPADLRTTERI